MTPTDPHPRRSLYGIAALVLILMTSSVLAGCISPTGFCGSADTVHFNAGKAAVLTMSDDDDMVNAFTKASFNMSLTVMDRHAGSWTLEDPTLAPLDQTTLTLDYKIIPNATSNDIWWELPQGKWTKFSIWMSVVSNDTVLDGYGFFNGTHTISGKMMPHINKAQTDGNEGSGVKIKFDKDYPGVYTEDVVEDNGYIADGIRFDNGEWDVLLLQQSISSLDC